MNKTTYIVTGGAGFIGANFVHLLAEKKTDAHIVVLDKLTYAGNLNNLSDLLDAHKIEFVRGDIADEAFVGELLDRFKPAYIVNFAAETHVDRSVKDPSPFIHTNIEGTYTLLEAARRQRTAQLSAGEEPTLKRFVQVSTDEVYGDLEIGEETPLADDVVAALGRGGRTYGPDAFSEETPIRPSSPYSASKASADMMAMAYKRSFGLPVVVTRCSNNYGPMQFPEKLIPLAVNNLTEGKPIPVYGHGTNVRDWIHVCDHCEGILAALERGRDGEVYNFGGYAERLNIDLVKTLVKVYEELAGVKLGDDAITFVHDRPGHDRRYAIDARKAFEHLGWTPRHDFEDGLRDTIKWYVENRNWVENVLTGDYRKYYNDMYTNRGL